MIRYNRRSLRTTLIVAFVCAAGIPSAPAAESSRNLNPYHEQQLENQIRACASSVVACTDVEQRCSKQQELCQLLLRADRFDEAIQVAYEIYKNEPSANERKAAYHFLVAEIHARKMKAAPTLKAMEASRQAALAAAQDVINKNYPKKWNASEYAGDLIKELNDPQRMGSVRNRVASREGRGDATKESIADAQRRYLDATQRRGSTPVQAAAQSYSTSGAGAPEDVVSVAHQPERKSRMGFSRHRRGQQQEAQDAATQPMRIEQAASSPILREQNTATASVRSLPSEPRVSRVVSPMQRLSEGEQSAMNRLGASGLLTSQPGVTTAQAGTGAAQTVTTTRRQPILVNGEPANAAPSPEEVQQNNLAQLLEAAKRRKASERRSPYATGQLPESR